MYQVFGGLGLLPDLIEHERVRNYSNSKSKTKSNTNRYSNSNSNNTRNSNTNCNSNGNSNGNSNVLLACRLEVKLSPSPSTDLARALWLPTGSLGPRQSQSVLWVEAVAAEIMMPLEYQ